MENKKGYFWNVFKARFPVGLTIYSISSNYLNVPTASLLKCAHRNKLVLPVLRETTNSSSLKIYY